MGFHHVGQTGLELLAPGDLPASASQSAGITGVSHRAWPPGPFLIFHTTSVNLFFSFLRQNLALSPGWSAVTQSQLTATSASLVQVIPLPQPPKVLGLQA